MQPTGNQPAPASVGETPILEFQPPRLRPLGRVTDLTKAVSTPGGSDFFDTSG